MTGTKTEIERIVALVMAKLEERAGVLRIPVNASNRHVHLTEKHYHILFGDLPFVKIKDLLQTGEYASNRVVDVEGPKRAVKGVRVLGPFRSQTQVELAQTDFRAIGVEAGVRMSGDIRGAAPVTLIGPAGQLELREGAIIAQRHIHMSPADAVAFGVKDGELLDIRVEGPRPTVFCDTVVRVREGFVLEMHLDTDEANALGNTGGQLYGTVARP